MPAIRSLSAQEILDSRGRPTIEVCCTLESGASACASVPSGASTGSAEALELRDGDPARYRGLGCRTAVHNVVRPIASALTGVELESQQELLATLIELDGTADKSRLGANAILWCLWPSRGPGSRAGHPFVSTFRGYDRTRTAIRAYRVRQSTSLAAASTRGVRFRFRTFCRPLMDLNARRRYGPDLGCVSERCRICAGSVRDARACGRRGRSGAGSSDSRPRPWVMRSPRSRAPVSAWR